MIFLYNSIFLFLSKNFSTFIFPFRYFFLFVFIFLHCLPLVWMHSNAILFLLKCVKMFIDVYRKTVARGKHGNVVTCIKYVCMFNNVSNSSRQYTHITSNMTSWLQRYLKSIIIDRYLFYFFLGFLHEYKMRTTVFKIKKGQVLVKRQKKKHRDTFKWIKKKNSDAKIFCSPEKKGDREYSRKVSWIVTNGNA